MEKEMEINYMACVKFHLDDYQWTPNGISLFRNVNRKTPVGERYHTFMKGKIRKLMLHYMP